MRKCPSVALTGAAVLSLTTSPVQADVLVEIQGAVQQPGTYIVGNRATFAELIHTAGGLSPKADRQRILQTRRIAPPTNGSKLLVTIPFLNSANPPVVLDRRSLNTPRLSASVSTTESLPSELQGEWPLQGIAAWEMRRFPLAVWVEPLVGSPFDERYTPMLVAALDRWNALWQGELGMRRPAFKLVAKPEQANILVRWRRLRKEIVGSNTLGTTVPVSDQTIFRIPGDPARQQYLWKRLKKAFIELDLFTNSGKYYNPTAMYLIAVHELGHALGAEHTTDPRDLMYPALAVPADDDREAEAATGINRVTFDTTLAKLRSVYGIVDFLAKQ